LIQLSETKILTALLQARTKTLYCSDSKVKKMNMNQEKEVPEEEEAPEVVEEPEVPEVAKVATDKPVAEVVDNNN
jgi:hypothetical protein